MVGEIIGERLGERAKLAAQAAREGRRSVSEKFLTSLIRRVHFGGAGDKFFLVPQDLRTIDTSFADEFCLGNFGFAGQLVSVGEGSPFDVVAPGAAWARALQGFGWLRHMRGCENEMAVEAAGALVAEWARRSNEFSGIAWESGIAARRLISLISHGPTVLRSVSDEDYGAVLSSLSLHINVLSASHGNAGLGLEKLTALSSLVLAGLCLEEREGLIERFAPDLGRALEKQIYPDGGHVSRNPEAIIELLLDLLPMRQCFLAREIEVPDEIDSAINRMLVMLRFLRLGDGETARFNGMSGRGMELVGRLLSYDDTRDVESGHALESHYARLVGGSTVLLVDGGGAPDLPYSERAHAGSLSFELSSGACPILINCGAPAPAYRQWALNGRATAFHSAVTIENSSSARLLKRKAAEAKGGDAFLSGPDDVSSELRSNESGCHFVGSHNGYSDRYGVVHVRQLQLDNMGRRLEGEDHLYFERETAAGREANRTRFAAHFHVHPDVKVTWPSKNGPVFLALASGEVWSFSVAGQAISLEESMFLSDSYGPRRGLQIVVRGSFSDRVKLRWALSDVSNTR